MPSVETLGPALAGVLALAAALVLAGAWPWKSPRPTRLALGWTLGLGLSFLLGGYLLTDHPRWPLAEDQDRLLGLLLPVALVVEVVAAFARVPRGLAWALRLVVAAGAAPVLLYHT